MVQAWSCRTARTKSWKPLAKVFIGVSVAAVMVHTGMTSVMGQNSFRPTSAEYELDSSGGADAMISIEELRARADVSKLAWKLYNTALREDRKGHQQQARGLAANAVRTVRSSFSHMLPWPSPAFSIAPSVTWEKIDAERALQGCPKTSSALGSPASG